MFLFTLIAVQSHYRMFTALELHRGGMAGQGGVTVLSTDIFSSPAITLSTSSNKFCLMAKTSSGKGLSSSRVERSLLLTCLLGTLGGAEDFLVVEAWLSSSSTSSMTWPTNSNISLEALSALGCSSSTVKRSLLLDCLVGKRGGATETPCFFDVDSSSFFRVVSKPRTLRHSRGP